MSKQSTPPNRTCETCGSAFYRKASIVAKGQGRFCSRLCIYSGKGRIPWNCEHCNTVFLTWQYALKIGQGRFCSKPCGNAHRTRSAIERFTTKYVPDGDCWRWIAGAFGDDSYGAFSLTPGKNIGAHVASYTLFRGPVPADRWVLHTCDHPWCVNPVHLWLGTALDNVVDMTAKGRRGKTGGRVRSVMTECRQGHPYGPIHSLIRPNGERRCRTCDTAHQKARREKRRAG